MIDIPEILEQFRMLRDHRGFRHVFVLVDPLSASVPLESWSMRVPANRQWILRDPQVRDATFPCPKLLLLDEEADELLAETVVAAGPGEGATPNPAVCGWLFARGIPADVPRHLVEAMQQRNAEFAPVLLRFTDPRVLPRLNHLLEPEQRQQLLGPAEHWFAVNRFGVLSDLQTQPAAPYVSTSLSLTAEQWSGIELLENFNRSLAAYAHATGEPLIESREAELDEALKRAAARQIDAPSDAITFALYSLIIHPEFDQHPAVAEVLAKSRVDGTLLTDALSQIPEEVWAGLARSEPETPAE